MVIRAAVLATALLVAGAPAMAQDLAGAPPVASAVRPTASAPTVAYVERQAWPELYDHNMASNAAVGAVGGVIGAVIGMAIADDSGRHLVHDNEITNPGNDVAAQIAAAYAKTYGYQLGGAPLVLSDDTAVPKGPALLQAVGGARYLIDINVPVMGLQPAYIFSQSSIRYEERTRVIDTVTGKVIQTASCRGNTKIKQKREQLLADHARDLKQLVGAAAQDCVEQTLGKLKLTQAQPTDLPTRTIAAASELDASCSEERQAYARQIGVDCHVLGQRRRLD